MRKKRLRKKNGLALLTMLLFLAILIFSSFKIINYIKDNYINRKIQENISKKFITVIEPESTEEKVKDTKYDVDFTTLKKQNPDTVAYLKVDGTSIDYIVVRGQDNSYYLKHNFEKTWNISGWIFSDYRNRFNGTDNNIVIFGHNIRDGSMFGTLKNVLNNEWQKNENNLKITLVTENDTYYYQVFSTYEINPEEYYINTEFNDISEFDKFINIIKSRSNYNYNIEIESNDKILTLSSCTVNGTKRIVLHAKLINNE